MEPNNTDGSIGNSESGASHAYDREQIAQFMLQNESALRRRIGAEVGRSPGVDADDVFSTTLRRVDYAAAKGSFAMRSKPEAWSFVAQVVNRAVARHRRRAARFAATVAKFAVANGEKYPLPWECLKKHSGSGGRL